MAARREKEIPATVNFDGFTPYTHECGWVENGLNLSPTRSILAGMSKNPNAAGVLFAGLGCEINDLASFKPSLGVFVTTRVKFIAYQDVEDEFEESLELLIELHAHALTYQRETVLMSKLIVGSNCAGADGFSGLTANQLAGEITDILTAQGGTSVMTEVPEMFGAERILMDRAVDEND